MALGYRHYGETNAFLPRLTSDNAVIVDLNSSKECKALILARKYMQHKMIDATINSC